MSVQFSGSASESPALTLDGVDARLARSYVRVEVRAPAAATPRFVRLGLHYRFGELPARCEWRGLVLGVDGTGHWIGWVSEGVEAITVVAPAGVGPLSARLRQLTLAELIIRLEFKQFRGLTRLIPLALRGPFKGAAIRFTRLVERLSAPAYRDWLAALAAEGDAPIPVDGARRVIACVSAGSPREVAATVGDLQAQTVAITIRATGEPWAPPDPGDLVLTIPAGTRLVPEACAALMEPFLRRPDTRLSYADFDHIGAHGERSSPVLQSAWSARLWQAGGLDLTVALVRGSEAATAPPDAAAIARAAPQGTVAHVPRILSHRPLPVRPRQIRVVVRPQPDPLPPVSVLIPTRDRLSLLGRCVEGVLGGTRTGPLDLVILDNDSVEPDTLAAFARWRQDPRVRIETVSGPFNYARMMNRGMRIARHDRVVQLNNDVETVAPDWLAVMLAELEDAEVGVVGARLLFPDGRLQHGGVTLGDGFVARHAFAFTDPASGEDGGAQARCRDVSVVTGACLATRRSVWDAVGGMDETHLKVAFNDVDYCLKVRAHGMRVVYQPAATLIHRESVSRGPDATPAQVERFQHETATMVARWSKELMADPFFNPQRALGGDGDALAAPPRDRQPRWT